jgi:hypothetical protein
VIITSLMDYDGTFHSTNDKIVLTDLPLDSDRDRDRLRELLMTTYVSDTLSSLPTCTCGLLVGGYNIGVTCNICNTEVKKSTEEPLRHRVWIEVPDGVLGFISPRILMYWSKILKSKNSDILQWMLNPNHRFKGTMSKKLIKRIDILQSAGYVRGINSFISNYEKIIDLLPRLMYADIVKDMSNSMDVIDAQKYLRKHINVSFPRRLPMPASVLLILESTAVGYYTDKGVSDILDAVLSLCAVKNIESIRGNRKETVVVNALYSLLRYYNISLETQIGKKEGGFRSGVWSSKGHFTARAVIAPLHEPHNFHEIHIPWTQGLLLFRFHIISKLLRRGYSILAANDLITANAFTYNETINDILKELISEAPLLPSVPFNTAGSWLNTRGMPVQFDRNPSLKYISDQNFYITHIKTDVNDKVIAISNLTLAGPNADRQM